ncbi:MAG: helix-turn-helix domain-containing protein [Clostridiales bacterium]|nr:helix-turn-helix domain-containing protein [Clostridiales bacterium]
MDCKKAGKLILGLRKERGLTQKQLADAMNISDKAISKWERGLGFPDVSLLKELAKILNVNVEKILVGDLESNDLDGGNMKKIKFYTCGTCGNILTSTTEADISCCGRKLMPLTPEPADEAHKIEIEDIEGELYATFSHPMDKGHYISFIACASSDRVLIIKLYPEQGGFVRMPRVRGAKIYYACSSHGFFNYS